jgi:hypothetical protein
MSSQQIHLRRREEAAQRQGSALAHLCEQKEKPLVLVKQGLGLTGNADVRRSEGGGGEVQAPPGRRHASQPPLLAGPSADTESEGGVVRGRASSHPARAVARGQVVLALEAQGVEATPDTERNVALLAQALTA